MNVVGSGVGVSVGTAIAAGAAGVVDPAAGVVLADPGPPPSAPAADPTGVAVAARLPVPARRTGPASPDDELTAQLADASIARTLTSIKPDRIIPGPPSAHPPGLRPAWDARPASALRGSATPPVRKGSGRRARLAPARSRFRERGGAARPGRTPRRRWPRSSSSVLGGGPRRRWESRRCGGRADGTGRSPRSGRRNRWSGSPPG